MLTVFADAQLPLHSTAEFSGGRGMVLAPTLAFEEHVWRVTVEANAGARIPTLPATLLDWREGNSATFGLGVGVDVIRHVAVGAEAHMLVGVPAAVPGLSDFEWLGSVRAAFIEDQFTIMAGGSLTRAVLGVAFAPRWESRKEIETPKATARATTKTCDVVCKADSYSGLPHADELALTKPVRPFLEEMGSCLASVGAENIHPAVFLRFSESGTSLLSVRADVGGFESLECVKSALHHVPAVTASRGTTVRCELGCLP
jgi:hypothetical protein